MTITIARAVLVLLLSGLTWACTDAGERTSQRALGATLTDHLRFRAGRIVEGSLPRTTAQEVAVLALGPTVSILPSSIHLMPLEVRDPRVRLVEATLIQFEDAGAYVRVPVREGGGSTELIENELTASDDLCAGLCNALFSITVTEAIELEDGRVSATTTRQVVIDCREHGDPEACDPDVDVTAETQDALCGDPTSGASVWTGDPVLDAHFEAVRLLRVARDAAEQRVGEARAAIAQAFGLDATSSSAEVQAELASAVELHTEDGITGLIGDRGCATRVAQVAHVLSSCDAEAPSPLSALQCTGACEPQGDAEACAAADVAGCRGLQQDASCEGLCTGACELELAEPAACAGTCIGTCDGECPGDAESCEGPCTGMCTGACRLPSAGEACAGDCTGLCETAEAGDALACDEPLVPYCRAEDEGALACPGDCFAGAGLDAGLAACRASALAAARAFPRCEPALVQLSFAFAPEGDPAEQAQFAVAVDALNAPLVELFELLARLDLLLVAADELSASAQDELAPRLEASLADMPDDPGLACAQDELPRTAAWLEDQPAALGQLRDEVLQLMAQPVPVP